MNRTRFDWETIRAEYETGATQSDLSRRHGCSRKAIQMRLEKEGWTQDITDTLNRLTAAKVAGVVAGCDPQKKAVALDMAASQKAAVVARHKTEWEKHQRLIDDAVHEGNFDRAKLAKITAEVIQIRQAGERKAWGILDIDVRPRDQASGLNLNLIMRGNDGCKPESALSTE